MSLREDLRDLNARLEPDDAPPWAEVLGAVLPAFIAIRGGLHAATALVAGDLTDEAIDPHLTGHGLTLASPVVGLRGHRFDRVARYVVGVVGVGGYHMIGFSAIGHPLPRAWLMLNVLACAADPALYGIDRLRTRYNITLTPMLRPTANATDGGTDR